MKRILFIVIALCMCFAAFSQETEKVKSEATNEVKLNLLMSVLSFPEISYERVWTNNFGVGLSAAVAFDSDNNFQITPFGRFYFGGNPDKAFFIEMNAAFAGYKKYVYDDYYFYSSYLPTKKNTLDFGMGFATGYKYVNSKGFVGELYLGLGRIFDNNERFYPRVGISVGKQF